MAVRILAAVVVLTLTASPGAQAPPKPGPEVERLAAWIGTWQGESVMKGAVQGTGAKTTLTTTCEWFEGKFQVVCHRDTEGPSGKAKTLMVMAYDPEQTNYKVFAISSTGERSEMTGTVSGNTWTWTGEQTMQGKPTKIRGTMEISSTSLTSRTEVSPDASSWTVIAEGKATKVK